MQLKSLCPCCTKSTWRQADRETGKACLQAADAHCDTAHMAAVQRQVVQPRQHGNFIGEHWPTLWMQQVVLAAVLDTMEACTCKTLRRQVCACMRPAQRCQSQHGITWQPCKTDRFSRAQKWSHPVGNPGCESTKSGSFSGHRRLSCVSAVSRARCDAMPSIRSSRRSERMPSGASPAKAAPRPEAGRSPATHPVSDFQVLHRCQSRPQPAQPRQQVECYHPIFFRVPSCRRTEGSARLGRFCAFQPYMAPHGAAGRICQVSPQPAH